MFLSLNCFSRSNTFFCVVLFFCSGCVNTPLTCLNVMFILGVVDLDDQLVFCYILLERLRCLLVSKLDLMILQLHVSLLQSHRYEKRFQNRVFIFQTLFLDFYCTFSFMAKVAGTFRLFKAKLVC